MIKKHTYIAIPLFLSSLLLASATPAAFYMPNGFYPNGYYAGIGLGFSSIDLGKLEVKKGGTTLVDDSPDSEKQPDAFVKFGYAFKTLPVQLGFSYQQNLGFDYNTSPLFNGRTDKLSSTITTHALFANATLNGNFGYRVIPFVTGGVGMSMNTVDMTYTNGSDKHKASKDTFHEAWQVGLGTHVKLTDNWLFNIAAYHQDLGKLTWGAWGSNPSYEIQNDELTANQVQIGLTYVFGDQHIPPSLIDNN